MNEKCTNCGKHPFCKLEPKEDCAEWIRRNYNTKLVKKEGLYYKFDFFRK